uniref:Paralemmin-1 n=1 Tax=Cynoglossus semilaevis TaxID=244447 RepID=A0A3P8UJJ7_CYNSE
CLCLRGTEERLHLITEKRKLQTEVENKRRQLEDDRRTLQHLKSQAVREQWLLDGASSAGPDQDQTKTRNLEATISRLEQELVSLETGTHTTEVQEEEGLVREPPSLSQKSIFPVEIPGLEARPAPESSVAEASTENPVTMVFMGYQSVEDEAETKRVLGLQGTVKAELVIIDDANNKTSAGEMPRNEVVKIKKEKQPCKCCTIM